MAQVLSTLLRARRSSPARRSRRGAERGATLSEYALIMSLILTVSIGVITLLEDQSGSYLVDTGSDIGAPRGLAADFGLDDPATPPWLTQPPAPTTTTSTTTPVGSTISPRHSGLCLGIEADSTADGAEIHQQTCSGATSQQWTITDVGGGYSEIQNVNSGLCVDVDGGSTANGAGLIQWTCHGGTNQQLTISAHPVGGDWLGLRHSGLCIDIPGSSTSPDVQIIQWSCHTGSNQAHDIT